MWEQEDDNHSLNSFDLPTKGKFDYDSRPPSSYGGNPYEAPQSRALSPAASYANIRQSGYEMPQLSYGSPLGMPGMIHDQRSIYGGGAPRSMYADDPRQGSIYGDQMRAASFYGAAPDPRISAYSLGGPHMAQVHPGMPDQRQSSFSLAAPQGQRASSYSLLADPQPASSESRPHSFLPELQSSPSGGLNAGAEAITSASLEQSVRRICQGADLETMTKRAVRKQLEEEYGVDLGPRKEELRRIIEDVLSGKSLTSFANHSTLSHHCLLTGIELA